MEILKSVMFFSCNVFFLFLPYPIVCRTKRDLKNVSDFYRVRYVIVFISELHAIYHSCVCAFCLHSSLVNTSLISYARRIHMDVCV